MKFPARSIVALAFFAPFGGIAMADAGDAGVGAYDAILAATEPGQTIVELGDMRVPVSTVRLWRDRLAGKPAPRSASQTGINRWPGGVVYYAFNANVSAAHRLHFLDACAEWATFANLTFTARTSQPNYIMVYNATGLDGGNSAVGMTGGQQQLNIGSISWRRGTLTHEIGHALGLVHEHQRYDRDMYVNILTQNTPGGAENGDFILIPESTNNGPYDFYSVMHYRRDAFSINAGQDTIQAKPGFTQFQDVMGRGYMDRWLSRGDRDGIAAMYGPGPPASLVVTNTKDSGPGSLRAALYHALDAAADSPEAAPVITFQIPATDPNFSSGVFTIRPTDGLIGPGPRVTIDATTQTAYTGNTNPKGPEVELNGAGVSNTDSYGVGVRLGDNGTTVRGMVINGFPTRGVLITGTNNRVEGCYIGTNAAGTGAVPNTYSGIEISGGATGNRVGGSTVAARNVISGNDGKGVIIVDSGTGNNAVTGNFIGTNAAGTAALANGSYGVGIWNKAGMNLIGGTAAGEGNVISGNEDSGVSISGSGTDGNVIAGNFIGTNATGTAALSNNGNGVSIYDSARENMVGGTAGGARNVISGNDGQGVMLSGNGTTGNTVAGNYIGTNAAGTAAVPNDGAGVNIFGGARLNMVGGAAGGAGNVISGNREQGVAISGAGTSGNTVAGCLVGLSAAGTMTLANSRAGIQIYGGPAGTVIGAISGGRNFIAGNGGPGITVSDSGTDGTAITGNSIGVAPGGTVVANAGDGITIYLGALNTTVGGSAPGAANVISGNAGHGIAIHDQATTGSRLSGNSISANSGLGINLEGGSQNGARVTANDNGDGDSGPNRLQNFPVLSSAAAGAGTTISGSLNGAANTVFRIEFFASPAADGPGNGEGRYFAGVISGTTSAAGNLPINTVLPAVVPAGYVITATATDPAGNTSEFSAARTVTAATDSDGDGMPDAWESSHGLLTNTNDAAFDADGDGAGNLSEFRTGTDPRDPRSILRPGAVSLTGAGVDISFPTVPGKVYRVDYAPRLSPGPAWQCFADQIYGTGLPQTVNDPGTAGAAQRFYRIAVIPP